jgi:hypothetical protein
MVVEFILLGVMPTSVEPVVVLRASGSRAGKLSYAATRAGVLANPYTRTGKA